MFSYPHTYFLINIHIPPEAIVLFLHHYSSITFSIYHLIVQKFPSIHRHYVIATHADLPNKIAGDGRPRKRTEKSSYVLVIRSMGFFFYLHIHNHYQPCLTTYTSNTTTITITNYYYYYLPNR